MNTPYLLALLVITTSIFTKEQESTKTVPQTTVPKNSKEEKKETEPAIPIIFLTPKEIEADKEKFSNKCSSLLLTDDLTLPKGVVDKEKVFEAFKKICNALKEQNFIGIITEKENYIVAGTTENKAAREIVEKFLKNKTGYVAIQSIDKTKKRV